MILRNTFSAPGTAANVNASSRRGWNRSPKVQRCFSGCMSNKNKQVTDWYLETSHPDSGNGQKLPSTFDRVGEQNRYVLHQSVTCSKLDKGQNSDDLMAIKSSLTTRSRSPGNDLTIGNESLLKGKSFSNESTIQDAELSREIIIQRSNYSSDNLPINHTSCLESPVSDKARCSYLLRLKSFQSVHEPTFSSLDKSLLRERSRYQETKMKLEFFYQKIALMKKRSMSKWGIGEKLALIE